MNDAEIRPPFERFAVPYQFQPKLTLYGALLAVMAALIQIVFGSLLAALWGVRIWLAAVSLHSVAWKSFVILSLSIAMLLSLGILVLGTRAVVTRLSKSNAP